MRIEPPPSLACASGTTPAATAAAEPPDEPPVRIARGSTDCAPDRRACDSVVGTMPNSGTLVLPSGDETGGAKTLGEQRVVVRGKAGMNSAPCRVGMPSAKAKMSLRKNGTPVKRAARQCPACRGARAVVIGEGDGVELGIDGFRARDGLIHQFARADIPVGDELAQSDAVVVGVFLEPHVVPQLASWKL